MALLLWFYTLLHTFTRLHLHPATHIYTFTFNPAAHICNLHPAAHIYTFTYLHSHPAAHGMPRAAGNAATAAQLPAQSHGWSCPFSIILLREIQGHSWATGIIEFLGIIEYPDLEGTHKDDGVQLLTLTGQPQKSHDVSERCALLLKSCVLLNTETCGCAR